MHSWLQNVNESSSINGLKFVALALCVPVFHLSHFFFKLTYRIQKFEMVLLSRKCARLGGKNCGLQFDGLRLDGRSVIETFHNLRDFNDRLE